MAVAGLSSDKQTSRVPGALLGRAVFLASLPLAARPPWWRLVALLQSAEEPAASGAGPTESLVSFQPALPRENFPHICQGGADPAK